MTYLKIQLLSVELVKEYKNEITQMYYLNVSSNAFFEHFTYSEADEKIDSLISYLTNQSAIVFGAFDNKKLCGFIWAYVHWFREEQRIYVSEIRVKEVYRRQGIGTELLKAVEKKAQDMGLEAVYLHAEANNPDAVRLYERIGYKPERIQMRKPLKLQRESFVLV